MLGRQTELRVEVNVGEVPITGHLTDEHGERTAFAGWTQLVSLIERASSGWAGLTSTDEATPPSNLPRRNP